MHEKGTGNIGQGRDERWAPGGEWDSLRGYRNDNRFVITRGVDSFGNRMPGPFGVESPSSQDILRSDTYDSSETGSDKLEQRSPGFFRKIGNKILNAYRTRGYEKVILQAQRDASYNNMSRHEQNPFSAENASMGSLDVAAAIGQQNISEERVNAIKQRYLEDQGVLYRPDGSVAEQPRWPYS